MANATQVDPTKKTTSPVPASQPVTALTNTDDYFESLESADPQDSGARDVTAPFVGLLNAKTPPEKAEPLKAAGVQLNQNYLSRSGQIIPLKKFQYFLAESKKFFTKQNRAGFVVDAKITDPGDKDYQEHGYAVLLVVVGDTLVPARYQARGGAYQCLKAARQTREKAADAVEFGKMGDAYKLAATLPLVARFTATASATMQKSAASGNDYIKGQCTTAPTTVDLGLLFKNVSKTPEFQAELTAVRQAYSNVVAATEKKVTK